MSSKNINQRRRLMRMHNLGWTTARIAKNLGISHQRVSQLIEQLRASGIQTYLDPKPTRAGLHALASEARAIMEVELKKMPWALGNWSIEDVMLHLESKKIILSQYQTSQLISRMGYRLVWVHLPTHLKFHKAKESA